ncbi:Secreted protein, containing von Willebrand factor (VWF) type A domain [uncultured Candidatus Thioglobus sp.]|nr:Secreted protein, containing von Willebrand factor (VWF) type A domain [uncultured Candidatus Thioglobus sp.]
MKFFRREFNIFNLSFLDIISCGFGAIVMLILIAKPNEDISVSGKEEVKELLQNLISLQNAVAEIQQEIENRFVKVKRLADEAQALKAEEARLQQKIQQEVAQQSSLSEQASGLALVESTLKNAAISVSNTKNTKRDIEVGGIPVDSDYVIFIVDTSGSMQQIWRRVSHEMINVLDIHPKVKGFQVLNDMGKSLISGYDGKWIRDTPKKRASVIKLFALWRDVSNSSPIEGLQVALQKYAKPNIKTSIYVFGDDYTGASYDHAVAEISKKNTLNSSGKKLARIHAVGFISPGVSDRFSILMRELTRQNKGTFLALP